MDLSARLIVEIPNSANTFILAKRYEFVGIDGETMAIPLGFETDFASIPRPLLWLFNRNGLSRKASVIHDFLYCNQLRTRQWCDHVFYEALIELGMARWKARLYFAGVRAGGWTRGSW